MVLTGETYEIDEAIVEAILKLDELAKILRKGWRLVQSLWPSWGKVSLNELLNPTGVYFKEAKDANKLIEEFMLLANRRVAEFIGKGKSKHK